MDKESGKLDVLKLRDLALLWCDGGKTEKAVEFFENILPSLAINLASHDKNFSNHLKNLFYFSTEMVFNLEEEFVEHAHERAVTQADVDEVKEEYDELVENFIDDIFGVQTIM
jgi:hypothetical protein